MHSLFPIKALDTKSTTLCVYGMSPVQDKEKRDTIINFFKRFLNESKNSQSFLSKFYRFIAGYENSNITIEINLLHESEQLPVSHTCFYRIDIPYVGTYEQFKSKLNKSIEYGYNDQFALL